MEHIVNMFVAGWCADAVGARLEFQCHRFSDENVNDAMRFTGINYRKLADGQFTDDSEMEIAMMKAIISEKPPSLSVESVAKEYIRWYDSEPQDVGQSIMFALMNAVNSQDMIDNANDMNSDSESNGSIMRCAPIAVLGISKSFAEIMEIAKLDASLTHPSEVVSKTTGIYCCILSYILSKRIKKENVEIDKLLGVVKRICDTNQTVSEWYREGMTLAHLEKYDAVTNEGHVKHAFIMVIYFMNHIEKYTYRQAIFEVLKCGGDTDTNAKIIGNIFGAYANPCIPRSMLMPVVNCNSGGVFTYKCGLNCVTELVKLLNILSI